MYTKVSFNFFLGQLYGKDSYLPQGISKGVMAVVSHGLYWVVDCSTREKYLVARGMNPSLGIVHLL